MRICDRCKKPAEHLIPMELTNGWNFKYNVWNYIKIEVCRNCRIHYEILKNNASMELERRVNSEFLSEVKESIYESLR
jgi:hypothetical protein